MNISEIRNRFINLRDRGFVPTKRKGDTGIGYTLKVSLSLSGSNIRQESQMNLIEICNECGRSVKSGSGFFINRVPDLNDPKTRKSMVKPFPEGDFICAECNEEIYDKRDTSVKSGDIKC